MSLPLLLAVAADPASPGLVERFGIEPHLILMQAVGFLILFGVLYYFGIKPVIAAMDDRAQKIGAGLKYAEEMKAQLATAQQAADLQLKEAQIKAREIMAEAQKAAKDFADRQQQEAVEKANGLVGKAQEAIALEKKKMLAEARTEITRLVVATTQKVLAKELSELERGRFNEAAARELTQA